MTLHFDLRYAFDNGHGSPLDGEVATPPCGYLRRFKFGPGNPVLGAYPYEIALRRLASSAVSDRTQFRKVAIFGTFEAAFGQTIQ